MVRFLKAEWGRICLKMFKRWLAVMVFGCVAGIGCASQEETLGVIQERAIAECEVTARGTAFADCYKAYVEEHRPRARRVTAEEDKIDFFLDRHRTP